MKKYLVIYKCFGLDKYEFSDSLEQAQFVQVNNIRLKIPSKLYELTEIVTP